MRRAYLPIAALVVASLTALNACAQAGDPAAALAKWQAGSNYTQLPAAQLTYVAAGKVEVNEVFWYGCGHCYALDPVLESWNRGKPAFIEFVRTPVMWGPVHQQHARIYYTLQALNRPDLHAKVFEAIHKDHNLLAAEDQAQAREIVIRFFKDHGVTEKDFAAAYDSSAVADNMKRAQDATYRYGVTSVPQIFVNGKYMTDVSMAGGQTQLINLVTDLATSEQKR